MLYRCIKAVDIVPVIQVIDKLEFSDSKGVCAWVTKQGSVAPDELIQLVRGLGLGGIAHRLFCRKLMPFQNIAPHVDDHKWMTENKVRRFHVPLISHPDIIMRWPEEKVEVYLEPGFLWEVCVSKLHEIVNNADVERIHIQIDQSNATI